MKKTFLECARKYLGYTQQEIASLCDMTRQRYAALEKGNCSLRFGEVSLVFHIIKSLDCKYKHPFSWVYDYPRNFSVDIIRNCHLEDLLSEIEVWI